MFNTLKSLAIAGLLATSSMAAYAQDITLRATANSNENDEDYDGLVVFKNYVEAMARSIFTSPPLAARRACSRMFRCSTCPI